MAPGLLPHLRIPKMLIKTDPNQQTMEQPHPPSNSSKLPRRNQTHHNQLLITPQSFWLVLTVTNAAPPNAPTATANETLTMAKKKIWSTTRLASRPINSKSVTMRSCYSKVSQDAGLMSTSGIRPSHAASATSIKYLSGISKWASPRNKPWSGSTGTCKQDRSMQIQLTWKKLKHSPSRVVCLRSCRHWLTELRVRSKHWLEEWQVSR